MTQCAPQLCVTILSSDSYRDLSIDDFAMSQCCCFSGDAPLMMLEREREREREQKNGWWEEISIERD